MIIDEQDHDYCYAVLTDDHYHQYFFKRRYNKKWHSSHLLTVQNERNTCYDVHASFDVGSAFCRTRMHVHVYQTTERKLNVSVSCYLFGRP
jgi:hypothetical protein